jgi:glycogen debranching enzyme
MFRRIFSSPIVLAVLLATYAYSGEHQSLLPTLGIIVKGTDRQFCFTNKQAGTYYAEANAKNTGGWHGWFINAQKVMNDYDLGWERRIATTTVYPHQTVRTYADGSIETFTMVDSIDALVIDMLPARNGEIVCSIQPTLDFTLRPVATTDAVFFGRPKTAAGTSTPTWIGYSSAMSSVKNGMLVIAGKKGMKIRIVIAAEHSMLETQHIIDAVFAQGDSMIASRAARMERLLASSYLHVDNSDLNKAVQWAKLSLDALIMNQSVDGVPTKGIFAGLPWFNNYWGRDSFISLPGATYITGNFSDAREILVSYAKFQDTVPSSPNYGRIPNLATPTSISYNTADGTPRFVMALYDYVQYSRDTSLLHTLYPVVKRSIEGTLRYHTDSLCLLTHGDAESWMDAVGTNGPWSPRGNRANDVQAIWYQQLKNGADIAIYNGDSTAAQRWNSTAAIVKKEFLNRFLDPSSGLFYDHLLADGRPVAELRPNQLFCLDMLDNDEAQHRLLRSVTSQIIYEHGVGTLAQNDSNFHPYHHFEPAYVQDAAYHTGIVWTWLNGAAIDALCHHDNCETAEHITENMVHQILDRGCVGTLSELLDAYPRPGERQPRLSGTFSQAWSLAEFIRSIYQAYLGVTVQGLQNIVEFNPHLPKEFGSVEFDLHSGSSSVRVTYTIAGDTVKISHSPTTMIVKSLSLVKQTTMDSSSLIPLAPKIMGLDIPALRGPAYPILSLSQIRQSNPSSKVLFDVRDPIGDDHGPAGTYFYPTNVHFAPGILDITRAIIRYDKENVYFTLRYKDLANPGWHPEYGYQLTFSAIAIHRGTKEASTSVGLNSHYELEKKLDYDRLISVGGGIRVTDASNTVLCEYLPRAEDSANPIGNVREKRIEFSIPIEYLGTPAKRWALTILVGAQDDHGGGGVGEFRTVDAAGGEWTGGGKKDPRLPNVYDVLKLK